MNIENAAEEKITVIGAGLAGCEAAWTVAQRGIPVQLVEMRPGKMTAAHKTGNFAELVCSNSLGSDLPDRASGMLKNELRRLGSLIIACADATRVPAGGALAVARDDFSILVTDQISKHPNIEIVREEVAEIPQGITIIASGPLTSPALTEAIQKKVGNDSFYFYDALAPIIRYESIDMDKAFRASRYDRSAGTGQGDYINCPLTNDEYSTFIANLVAAKTIELHDFEKNDPHFFEGCLPIEILAARGETSLAFGPMRPVGILDPVTGKRPYALVQLRQDDLAGTLYNMVGFQTNMKWSEQDRIFRLIPGLEHAEFERFGQMHRNSFINAPELLTPFMNLKNDGDIFFAGQITGVEGYAGNVASGYIAGINASLLYESRPLITIPKETMIGALLSYVGTSVTDNFQPMKANFGLLPGLEIGIRNKRERYSEYVSRGELALTKFAGENGIWLR